MAVELCSDNSSMSPRISFSLDLCHFDEVPVDRRPLRSSKPSSLNSSIDFDFCVGESFEQQQPSSADELFSHGKILPTDIRKNNVPLPSKQTDHQPPPPPPPQEDVNVNVNVNSTKEDDQKQSSSNPKPSFWGFKRSRSFTCGNGYGRSLCPLPLLSRSNSTGSTPNIKQTPSNPKHINSHKHSSTSNHKPPLKKTGAAAAYKPYGNPVVLNVPSANLFGLGSIFSHGKPKNYRCRRK